MIKSVQRGMDRVLLLQEHPAPSRAPQRLTPREREVLDLVATGMRNDEIAQALWVSPATVRKHLENSYEKLGVHTRTAAVAAIHRHTRQCVKARITAPRAPTTLPRNAAVNERHLN
jgi:DNA-binding CsgD family transcriptional regulator